MPSLYRFRIFNADGEDILDTELGGSNDYIRRECRDSVGEYCVTPDYIRRECRDGVGEYCVTPVVRSFDGEKQQPPEMHRRAAMC